MACAGEGPSVRGRKCGAGKVLTGRGLRWRGLLLTLVLVSKRGHVSTGFHSGGRASVPGLFFVQIILSPEVRRIASAGLDRSSKSW